MKKIVCFILIICMACASQAGAFEGGALLAAGSPPSAKPEASPAAASASSDAGNKAADTNDDAVLAEVLDSFKKLAAIPRPSHHEKLLSDYLISWAKDNGFKPVQDKANNVIIDVPAKSGGLPTVILHAHMDMVCVSEESGFDPLTDPIEPVLEGDTLTAGKASLGADNGAGVAVILYILQHSDYKGALRALFTVNGEDGMSGAAALSDSRLAGDYLISLDYEDAGVVCTGGKESAAYVFERRPDWVKPAGTAVYDITAKGFPGGHPQGEKANAIRELGALLQSLYSQGLEIEIAGISGGEARNALPVSAAARVAVKEKDMEAFEEAFKKAEEGVKEGSFECAESKAAVKRVLPAKAGQNLAWFLCAVLEGVSAADGSGEAGSQNIGAVELNDDRLSVTVYSRGEGIGEADKLGIMNRALAGLAGFSVEIGAKIPAWEGGEKLPGLIGDAYKEASGKPMEKAVTNGSMECGFFGAKNPDLDMAAMGVEIDGAHSVNETLDLKSVPETVGTLLTLLNNLSK